jgi:GT2 family glycosyltransferase
MRSYKKEGFPERRGLVESAEILRNHRELKVGILNEKWWKVVDTFSLRDQLAFNYICWKDNFSYHKMLGNQWLDQYFHIYTHGQKIQYDNLPHIEIAILASNNLNLLENTINNIFTYTKYPKYSITIIYSNEQDHLLEEMKELSKKYDNLQYFIADKNDNTVDIVNTFIGQSTSDYVSILTDKTAIVMHDWLNILVSKILEEPKCIAIGPMILNKDFLIRSSSINIKKFTKEKIEYVENTKIGGNNKVDAISPFGSLINRKLLETSKKIDNKYDLKTAWIKFCVEAKQEGHYIYFSTDSEIVNLEKKSPISHIYL